jgi:nitronate monooxygenase
MATIQEILGTELPLIQAPMAGAQGSALAVAVCRAGGLGSQPAALLDTVALRHELAAITAATDKPFNVNFFCHAPPAVDGGREAAWRATLQPYYQELGVDPPDAPAAGRAPFTREAADLLAEVRPRVVSFHFCLPAPDLLHRVRATGAKVIASATTVAEAQWLEAQGVDAVIAQGLEAGGHRGHFLSHDLTAQLGTFALVPQVVRTVGVPVIAAGGIADAAGVAAAMALGAAAVQIGTAYLLCPEALITAVHRRMLASDAARHTALTNVFTGRPARSIVNRLMREVGPMSSAAPPFPLAAAALQPLRARAEADGSADFSPLWAGQHTTGRSLPAEALTRELARGVVR